ncbi:hypothetical protein C8Q78DRAFT_1046633 [Trametes maxima]|nr:hypothetical protein C8Q78DRAFT_1046633 [Trametes maxima]
MLASQPLSAKRTLNFLIPDSLSEEGRGGRTPKPTDMLTERNDEHGLAPNDFEMAIRLERLRVQEALSARDVAVERLAEACASVREKAQKIKHLSDEREIMRSESAGRRSITGADQESSLMPTDPASTAEVYQLKECIQTLETKLASLSVKNRHAEDPKENSENTYTLGIDSSHSINKPITPGPAILTDISNVPSASPYPLPNAFKDSDAPETPWIPLEGEHVTALPTASTAEKIGLRYAILAALPLPSGIPDDALTPIVIPPSHSLHDFIGTMSGSLRSQVGNYRVFQQSTTTWCPEREEHGYYLTPVFKCSTNPRVNTAHRWSVVDLSTKLDKPTECFFNKDGKWYYAGTYTSFRLEDLGPQEWECLSTETSQALVKETLAARKNTSPQNHYETGQLYSAGALKVACIGLQCIGFNDGLYRGLLEHAARCVQTGKWRATGYGAGGSSGGSTGLGFGGGPNLWNSVAHNVTCSPTAGFATTSGLAVAPTIGGTVPSSPIAPLGSPGLNFRRPSGLAPLAPSIDPQHNG